MNVRVRAGLIRFRKSFSGQHDCIKFLKLFEPDVYLKEYLQI